MEVSVFGLQDPIDDFYVGHPEIKEASAGQAFADEGAFDFKVEIL